PAKPMPRAPCSKMANPAARAGAGPVKTTKARAAASAPLRLHIEVLLGTRGCGDPSGPHAREARPAGLDHATQGGRAGSIQKRGARVPLQATGRKTRVSRAPPGSGAKR